MFKNIVSKRNRVLLSELIRTDFKLRYQGSVLGYLWSLLKPLILFAILFVVFTKFLRIGKGIPNYPISLLLGIVLWNFFIEATTSALKSIVAKGSLIRKIQIPRYLIPVAATASAFINLLLNLIVVMIFVFFASNTALSITSLIVFPLLLLEMVVFSLAAGFLLAAMYVRYRDIEHIWDVIKQALFYTIPIIYPLSLIPSEEIQKLIILNPLAQMIQDSRAVITYAPTQQINDLYGSWWPMVIPLSLVGISIITASIYFRKRSRTFAEDI